MGGGGNSAPANTTQTVTQQDPPWLQAAKQQNISNAQSLAQTPAPNYQGQLVAPINGQETAGINAINMNVGSWSPYLNNAQNISYASAGQGDASNTIGNWVNGLSNTSTAIGNGMMASDVPALNQSGSAELGTGLNNISLNPANTATVQQFMSPYIQAALNPQITQLNTQFGQQQQALNSQATEAGAFGDARQGVAQSLNNYYNNLATSGVEANGYNSAFQNAINTIQGQQQLGVNEISGANSAFGNAGQLQLGEQQAVQGEQGQLIGEQNATQGEQKLMQAQAAQEAGFGTQLQQQQLADENAQMVAGQLQQNTQQSADAAAYQQYMQQYLWQWQMQNALNATVNGQQDTNLTSQGSVSPPNANTQNTSGVLTLAGMLGNATGSTSTTGATS
jgi:hypothetical protein